MSVRRVELTVIEWCDLKHNTQRVSRDNVEHVALDRQSPSFFYPDHRRIVFEPFADTSELRLHLSNASAGLLRFDRRQLVRLRRDEECEAMQDSRTHVCRGP